MDRKRELVEAEDRGWAELNALIHPVPEQDLVRDGYYPDWSIKDMLAHIASWFAECANIFEQLRMGTHRREEVDVEALNRAWYETWRDKDLRMVRTELNAARWSMLEGWDRLREIDEVADEWFRESGPEHYDELLPRLREWVSELRADAR